MEQIVVKVILCQPPTLLSSPQRPGGTEVKIPLPPGLCITSRIPLYPQEPETGKLT